MSLIARQTNAGVPVLYTPFRFRFLHRRLNQNRDISSIEHPLEEIISKLYIQYDKKFKEIKIRENGGISINIFFFDKICSFLNLCTIFNIYMINRSIRTNIIFSNSNITHLVTKIYVKLVKIAKPIY